MSPSPDEELLTVDGCSRGRVCLLSGCGFWWDDRAPVGGLTSMCTWTAPIRLSGLDENKKKVGHEVEGRGAMGSLG